MKKTVALLVLISFFFAACEKDDICDLTTSTTPRLVLQFYDKNNVSLTRLTTNLKIVGEGEGMEETNGVPNASGGQTWNDTIVYLPLRINEGSTRFKLILNANDNNALNDVTDILEFNYTQSDVYISRGCGFKALFDLNDNPLENSFILNDTPNATLGNWINDIQVLQFQINNENEAHIKIFF
jgi:hypothetical protein